MISNNYAFEGANFGKKNLIQQSIKEIISNLFNILENNHFHFLDDLDDYSSKENIEFITTYLMSQRKLGMKKLTQIELLRTILDILVNAHAKYNMEELSIKIVSIMKERKLFWKIHKLFFDFPFCNIYQTYYCQIIEIALNENSPKILVESLLLDLNEKEENLINIFIINS